jgi:hypothetical protein
MKPSPEVERWFAETKHPLETPMRRVREIILRADPRITEYVKYRTPTFAYEGDLAAFVQMNKKHITLMFNRGARIQGRFPHLEGEGPTARFMRFADLAEVEARAAELSGIVAAWCTMMAPASGGASPGAKARPARGTTSAAKTRPPRSTKSAAKGRTGPARG